MEIGLLSLSIVDPHLIVFYPSTIPLVFFFFSCSFSSVFVVVKEKKKQQKQGDIQNAMQFCIHWDYYIQ